MALFCAAIKRDSFYHLMFPILNHVQNFSCVTPQSVTWSIKILIFLPISVLKFLSLFFFFCFVFLFVFFCFFALVLPLLLLAAVISLSFSNVFLETLYWCASTQSPSLASPNLPLFLYMHCLSVLSLECKALCIVINFLILWYICLSSFIKYLARGTVQVLFPLLWSLLQSFVSRSFLVLKYSFLIFAFISGWLMVSTYHILLCLPSFPSVFSFIFSVVVSVLSAVFFFPFFELRLKLYLPTQK